MLDGLLAAAEGMGIELRPKFIMVDFELAIINALQVTFPTVTICGCLFHLSQSIYRNIQKNGLVEAYRTNDETSLSLRKLSALAFLPPDEIADAFKTMSANAPEEIAPVYKYFEETYVLGKPVSTRVRRRGRPAARMERRHPPRFPPKLWSVQHLQENNLPRTNNSLEAWHRRFETVVERYHLGVFSTIREFIKENHRTDQEVERLTAGNTGVKKKKEQVQREERLRTVLARLGTIPVEDYLRGIAHNMQLSACQRVAEEETDSE